MVALKTAEVDAFVARGDPSRAIILVFGPDAGLVSERAGALVRSAVDNLDDPFSLVRLEGDELAADPAKLVDEAATIPLFGGRRAIWIRAGGRDFSDAVETVAATPLRDCRIVIEAGDLRRNAPLRVLCERSSSIAAIACYVDNERDLARLIDEEMRAANLTITTDARAALMPLLGADRRASRNELRKLALYAQGKTHVEIDDVLAAVADASALVLDGIVDAMFAGRTAEVESFFTKARGAGIAAARILAVAQIQAGQLHRARLAMGSGTPMMEAVDLIASKAQFRRKPAIETALKLWSVSGLERVMNELAKATLETRKLSGLTAPLSDSVVNRVLLMVATMARRKE